MSASVLITLGWMSLVAQAAPPKPAWPFQAWLMERLGAESAQLLRFEVRDLGGTGGNDAFACVSVPHAQGAEMLVVVGLATGERFALTDRGERIGSLSGGCFGSLEYHEGERLLRLIRFGMTGYVDSVALRFDRKGPLRVGDSEGSRYSENRNDFKTLTRRAADLGEVYAGRADEPEVELSALILAASPNVAAHLPEVPTWTSWGQQNWTGPKDATLRLRVVQASGNKVAVRLQASDDVQLRARGTEPKQLLRADHFELWWQEGSGDKAQIIQLGVAVDEAGRAVATWFLPPKPARGLPEVTVQEDGSLEVFLPNAWLFPSGTAVSFAAAFSDADDPKVGQETLITTTQQKPGPRVAPGSSLHLLPEGARYPRLETEVLDWVRLTDKSTLGSALFRD